MLPLAHPNLSFFVLVRIFPLRSSFDTFVEKNFVNLQKPVKRIVQCSQSQN
jgi:hypothetical protein